MFLDIGRAVENFPHSPVISHEVCFVFFFFLNRYGLVQQINVHIYMLHRKPDISSQYKILQGFQGLLLGFNIFDKKKTFFFESWSFLVEIRIGKVLFLWHAFHLLWQIVRCYGYTFLYFNYNIKVSALREKLGKEGKDSLR